MFHENIVESLKYIYAPGIVSCPSPSNIVIHDARHQAVWELELLTTQRVQVQGWMLDNEEVRKNYDPLEDDFSDLVQMDTAAFNLAATVYREIHPEPNLCEVISIDDNCNEQEIAGRLADAISQLRFRESMKPLQENYEDGVLVIEQAGGVCPFQAEGTLAGYLFYFRYRNGTAKLSVGGDDPVSEPYWKAQISYGEPLSGSLGRREFFHLFSTLSTQLTVAKKRYKFFPVENFGYPETLKEEEAALRFLQAMRSELGFPPLEKERLKFLIHDFLDKEGEPKEAVSCYVDTEEEALDWVQATLPTTYMRLRISDTPPTLAPFETLPVQPKQYFPLQD